MFAWNGASSFCRSRMISAADPQSVLRQKGCHREANSSDGDVWNRQVHGHRRVAARGYKAVDADCDEYSEWVEANSDSGDRVAGRSGQGLGMARRPIQDLLSTEDSDVLFLGGCAENMRKFLPLFDHVVLLSAPTDVIVERLAKDKQLLREAS